MQSVSEWKNKSDNSQPQDNTSSGGFQSVGDWKKANPTPVVPPEPSLFQKVTGASFKDTMASLPEGAKQVSDFLINKPIDYLGKKLYDVANYVAPKVTADVGAGLNVEAQNGEKNTGVEILKTLQQGQKAISGLTGGIITPKTETPDNIVSKIYGGFSEAIGSIVALDAIGTKVGSLVDTPKITEFISKYPLVSKYAMPFIKNSVGFSLYGQLDPNLGGDLGERFKKLGTDIVTSVPYTMLGAVKSAKIAIPASFTLGFGMAKLSGASNEDAFVSGLVLGGLDAHSRFNGNGDHFMTGQSVDTKLKVEARKTISESSGVPITDKTSPAEISKAVKKATKIAQETNDTTTINAVNSAENFLTGKNTNPIEKTTVKEPIAPEKAPIETPVTTENAPKTPTTSEIAPKVETPVSPEIKPVDTKIEPTIQNIDIPKELQPLAQEAKKYNNVDEFITSQPKLSRGTSDIQKGQIPNEGLSVTLDPNIANKYAKSRGIAGYVEDFYIKPEAKIIKLEDIPSSVRSVEEGSDFAGKSAIWARKNGYDVLDMSSGNEAEMRILNKNILTTREERNKILTDIWNKVNSDKLLSKTEIKPTEEKKTPMKPIGEGETRTPTLSKGVESKAIENKLTEGLGKLPEYNQVNMKDQASKAMKFTAENPAEALEVALGHKNPPKDILPESIFTVVENNAIKKGDIETLRRLANSDLTSEATAMGQRIRALAERDPESPVGSIQKVEKGRMQDLEKKLKGKKTVYEAKQEVAKEIESKIKQKTPKKQNWADFIKSIEC